MNVFRLSRQAILRSATHWIKIARENEKRAPSEKRLWSIAAEVQIAPRTWKSEIAQVYASDSASALAAYFVSQPKPVKIVGVAPTLGYWVNDKDGKELSTT